MILVIDFGSSPFVKVWYGRYLATLGLHLKKRLSLFLQPWPSDLKSFTLLVTRKRTPIHSCKIAKLHFLFYRVTRMCLNRISVLTEVGCSSIYLSIAWTHKSLTFFLTKTGVIKYHYDHVCTVCRVGAALHNLGQFYLVQKNLDGARDCYEVYTHTRSIILTTLPCLLI